MHQQWIPSPSAYDLERCCKYCCFAA